MKRYLDIGDHGYNGDFYKCGSDGIVFRADNLEIATKIAANRYLENFYPLYRSCCLTSIVPGKFTFSVTDHECDTIADETYTVEYHGPADMFTAEFLHNVAMENHKWYADYYHQMEEMLSAGSPLVRRSKRSGLIMFTINFPRYDKNGDWWSSETCYLSDNETLAAQQFEFLLSSETGAHEIIERNFSAMRKKEQSTRGN